MDINNIIKDLSEILIDLVALKDFIIIKMVIKVKYSIIIAIQELSIKEEFQ